MNTCNKFIALHWTTFGAFYFIVHFNIQVQGKSDERKYEIETPDERSLSERCPRGALGGTELKVSVDKWQPVHM